MRTVASTKTRVLVHRHEVDPADALGAPPGLVDDLVALALEEGLDRAHRLFLHIVHVLLLRLGGPPLWRALRRVSRMQRRRAGKGGSEVGRGYRNLPTSVFRVVRARSAWGEEPGKVSRPLLAARRRATLRVQGAPGRVSNQRGEGVRHGKGHGRRGFRAWDEDVGGCGGAHGGSAARSRQGRRAVPESWCRGMSRDGRLSRASCGRCAHEVADGEAVRCAERLRCCTTHPSEEGERLMIGIN